MSLRKRIFSFFRQIALPINPKPQASKNPTRLRLESLEDRRVMNASFYAVGAPAGQLPLVKIFESTTNEQVNQFLAYDPSFTGGVHVAMGDLNNDHQPDIITAPGSGGGPHIKVFDGKTLALSDSFFAYSTNFTGGVNVAAGDIGNGLVGIVTAPDGQAAPFVKVFNPTGGELKSFQAYSSDFQGGV